MANIFITILKRDLLLANRQRAEVCHPFIFFLMIISLFPLSLSPDPNLLATLAPGIVWVAILLATLLSLDRLFRHDVDDGIIEQWLLAPHALTVMVLAKIIAHWLVTGFCLLLFVPIVGVLLHLTMHAQLILMWSILLGTPTLSLVGAIFTALAAQLHHAGLLLTLLVLPFYIPILIFAASAVGNAEAGISASGQLAFLGAMLALALPLAPLATAAALKAGMQ